MSQYIQQLVRTPSRSGWSKPVRRTGFGALLMPVLALGLLVSPLASSAFANPRSRHADTWNFGTRCRIAWNEAADTLTPLPEPIINTAEGTASFSDPRTGELLIYSDGRTVWNAAGVAIATGLPGHSSSLHSAVIVPKPLSPNRLFVLAHSFTESAHIGYREIDVSGSPVAIGENQSIQVDGGATTGREGMVVVPHTNGYEFWILKSAVNGVFIIPVTVNGFGTPVRVDLGISVWTGGWSAFGVSNRGDRIVASSNNGGRIVTARFNRTTGVISDITTIRETYDVQYYGGVFSPDDTKFYFSTLTVNQTANTGSRLHQYDFTTDTMTMLDEQPFRYHTGDARLGPDGLIYVTTGNLNALKAISVIRNPNGAGLAADFAYGAIPMLDSCSPGLGLAQTVSPLAPFLYGVSIKAPVGDTVGTTVQPRGSANVLDGVTVKVAVVDANGQTVGSCNAIVSGAAWACPADAITGLEVGATYDISAEILGSVRDDQVFRIVPCVATDASIDEGCSADMPYCMGSGVGAACVACATDAHCDDGNACTVNACLGFVCRMDPVMHGQPGACDDGTVCSGPDENMCVACVNTESNGIDAGCSLAAPNCVQGARGPVCVACEADADCNDGIACTDDACVAGACVQAAVPVGEPGTCEGGTVCSGAPALACVPCVDTSRAGTDAGCDARAPYCTGDAEAGLTCEPCIDRGAGIDTGCNEVTPNCVMQAEGRACVACASHGECDDGNVCTINVCDAGLCRAESRDGQACLGGVCNSELACVALSVAIVTPAEGALLLDARPTIAGTATPGTVVTVVIDGVTVGTALVGADGMWTLALTSDLADGAHTAVAFVTVGASSVSDTTSFTVDATTMVAIAAPADGTEISDTTPEIRGTTEPFATVTVWLGDDSETAVKLGTVSADADGNWVLAWPANVAALSEGVHVVTAEAEDAVGNTAATRTTFTVETAAALAVAIVAPASGSTTTDGTPTISGTATPGAEVDVWLVVADGERVFLGTATADAGGNWSLGWPSDVAPLGNGNHTVVAEVDDGAGSGVSDTATFTVATETTLVIVAVDPEGQISGTGEPGATIVVTVDGEVWGETTVNPDGTWSIDGEAFGPGEHTIVVTATDAAGTTTTASRVVTVGDDPGTPEPPTSEEIYSGGACAGGGADGVLGFGLLVWLLGAVVMRRRRLA